MIDGSASGISTSLSSVQRVQPNAIAASLVLSGTPRMPSAVNRMTGGIPKHERRQHPRRLTCAEEGDDRDQVDERRHRLHEIEHRLGRVVGPLVLAEPDSQRDPQQHAQEGGGAEQGHRHHAGLPQAEQGQVGERGAGEHRDAGTGEPPRDNDDDRHDHRPRCVDHTVPSPPTIVLIAATIPSKTPAPSIDNQSKPESSHSDTGA